jgi:pimeloyl-ACP methyl ester carboxylesterase
VRGRQALVTRGWELLALVWLAVAVPAAAGGGEVVAPEAREGAAAAAAPEPEGPLARLAVASRAALSAAGLERREVEAAGRRLVLWRGGGGPHLVLLHGSGHNAGAWVAVAPALAQSYTVHALDLPGHGDSEPGEGPLAMATVVEGVEAYLKTLDGPAILVGNSFGAWLATVEAHRHPERVARVVLVNGGALFNVPPAGLSLTPPDRETARRTMAALRDPSAPALPDDVLDDVVKRAGSGPIGRLLQVPPSLMAHLLDGKLGEVAVPVDLLWGAADQLMTVAYAERMAAQLPRARLTLVERCGHIPHQECPERFLAALREVLALPPPEAAP